MSFEERYRSGPPPWDIGRPQLELLRLLDAGQILAPVLDVGCGTGESALACATRGLEVLGVDGAPTAIERAKQKAATRGVSARFEVGDALHLESLGRTFSTAVDVGLFHVFDDDERVRYVESLASVVRRGGHAFVLCFSDAEPDWGGPRRVRAEEIETAFGGRFEITEIRRAVFETNLPDTTVQAWLASLRRRST
jgi:cyclopropane fatty-acyl-phospholipid synthase-like methyltransferase